MLAPSESLLAGLEYGNGTEMNVTAFNSRLQATAFEVKKDTTTLISKQYDFNADGSLKFVDDMLNATFDRSYKYDQMGRTVEAKAGTAARGETPTGPHNLDQPYSRQYSHNAFGQITSFNGFSYGSQSDYNVSFTNGRNPQWTYDADGNVLADIDGSFEFDAAGRLVKTTATDVDDEQVYMAPTEDHFDGNGQVAKRVRNAGSSDPAEIVNYFISSSVLGRVVTETDGTGVKLKTFVHANGALLAEQEVIEYQQTNYEILRFVHQDASGSGVQQTLADGTLALPNGRTAEYDAMGRNVADPGPYVTLNTELPSENGSGIDLFGNGEGYRPGRSTYKVNGFVVPESTFMMHIGSFTFDLIQVAAQMSRMQFLGYTLRYGNGDETFAGFDEARAISRMEGGETLVRNWLVNDSWSVITMIIPQTGGKPAPLTDEENRELDTRIDKLIKEKLPKKSCKDFLIGRLGQAGYDKLIETLQNQGLRYSALRSTDITVEEADLYNNLNIRRDLIYWSDRRNTRRRADRERYERQLEQLDWSVSRFSRSIGIHAILGRADGQPVVYYASFKKITTILHENLHISTGLKDIPLAAALGLKDEGGRDFTDLRKASAAISKALIEKGCTN